MIKNHEPNEKIFGIGLKKFEITMFFINFFPDCV